MSLLTCHSWHITLDMSLFTCHFEMPLLTCHSRNVTLHSSSLSTYKSWHVTLKMSLLIYPSLHVILNMSLSTCHSWLVTLNMSLSTCHSLYVIIIYLAILQDFEISNFFVSNSLTLTRLRGAFAPKNWVWHGSAELLNCWV